MPKYRCLVCGRYIARNSKQLKKMYMGEKDVVKKELLIHGDPWVLSSCSGYVVEEDKESRWRDFDDGIVRDVPPNR